MRLTFLLLLILLLVLPASAKNDGYVEDLLEDWGGVEAPLALPLPLEWKAVHGRLGEFGDIDAVSFSFEEAFEDWSIEVRVPVCGAHFEMLYPSIAVIGAGLESPEDANLPFDLPEGHGAVVLEQGERLDPRITDESFSFFYESPSGTFYNRYYMPMRAQVDIPAAGDYTLAIWEPDGHVGAYFLWIGNEHPNDMSYRNMDELEDVFHLIGSGAWMGQDCDAPLNAQSCPPALDAVSALPEHDFPERSELGEGFVLTGTIYDAMTCTPLAGAEIDFELAGASGEFDEANTGTVYTNQQGAYRIISDATHRNIRLYVQAEGYDAIMTEQALEAERTEARLDVSLPSGS